MADPSSDSITSFTDAPLIALALGTNSSYWLDLYNSNRENNALSSSSPSKRDYEWGYVYENTHKTMKRKNNWSAVNSSSDISEALSSISAHLSLSSPSESSHGSGERCQLLGHKGKMDDSTENHPCCDIHSLSSESDWDDLFSLDGDGKVQATEMSYGSGQADVRKPELGMEFCSQEEAYEFYRNYAIQTGFRVRKGKVQRLADGSIRKQYFFCSRQGFKTKQQSKKKTKYKRKETRTGCGAKIQCTVENGKWIVSLFSQEHNHNLEGQKRRTSSRAETSEAHLIIQTNDKARTTTNARATECSEFGKTCLSASQSVERKARLEHEHAESSSNNLKHVQVGDLSFFYSVQGENNNSHVENFFWRDSRSKIEYELFGDVLILDTTYRLENFDRTYAIFFGLNHHRQYVLFGGAFLIDESTDSFVWLIETFKEAMGRHQPRTIITGESEAMADAVKVALPGAKHRLGLWYIHQNALKHLSRYYAQLGFENLFNECISGCLTEQELESKWNTLQDKFCLSQNCWLNTLYNSKERWAHIFNQTTFSAGIEMNANIWSIFQDINSEPAHLSAFIEQYLKAAEEQRRKESYDDDSHCNKIIPVITGCAMEKQAADAYTSAMFKMFQEELLKCFSLPVVEVKKKGTVAVFELVDDGLKKIIVEKSTLDSSVVCSCKKYESVGILCCHALRVLNVLNIFDLPSQYILKRWTKHAKDGVLADVQ